MSSLSSPPLHLSSPPIGPPFAARDGRRSRCSTRRLPRAHPLSSPSISLLFSPPHLRDADLALVPGGAGRGRT
jgi:hypothetical protein